MLTPLRRRIDGWPCMVGDLRGRRMRTGSKIENLSTVLPRESQELQLLLLNFLCYVNRAACKCSTKIHPTSNLVNRLGPLYPDDGCSGCAIRTIVTVL